MGNNQYEDIIHLKHPVSVNHPRMPVAERAAQFSPFASLAGYGEAVGEAGRQTDARKELEEDARERLDGKLQMLMTRAEEFPEVAVTYFRPDGRKEGGAYVTVNGRVKKIDIYGRNIVMMDGTRISVEDIVDLDKREESCRGE